MTSLIITLLLSIITLTISDLSESSEQYVLARFYSNFVQLYRPILLKSYKTKLNHEQSIEYYRFLFNEKEYLQIVEDSITILNINILERTIIYHSTPNFEINGTRYIYHRDLKDNDGIEIELFDAKNNIFRHVQKPNHYFYLSSYTDIEYLNQIPIMPYYEVIFKCKSLFTIDSQIQTPLLSYINKNIQWIPRYTLDLSLFNTNKQPEMQAYADIRNNGEQSIIIESAEFIAGDRNLNQRPIEYLRSNSLYLTNGPLPLTSNSIDNNFIHALDEQVSSTHVYQLSLSSSMIIPSHSIKSIKFFETNITIEQFLYYSSEFSIINSNGKLINAFNLTSYNNFIPNGHLTLYEQGRLIGQINLPDITQGEIYMMKFGYDSDVIYHRQVTIIEDNPNNEYITYYIEYIFENYKLSHDIHLYFIESFKSLKYYQIKKISKSKDNKNLPDLISYGTDLRGYFIIPCQRIQKIISYYLITNKITYNLYK
ncbi:unnamed protein product [Rotaria sp. Silwood1]|nr:unnamed protein product [Rotaria sp. Silwood1]CAF3660311.1 unnamed protein product [Rotaria sp. Silwood1]CAF4636246.1 unnamed protein product [Rotaria sp. Silwood1]